jgi:hypothetical protein
MEGKFGNGVSSIRTILWLTLASKRDQANQGVVVELLLNFSPS